MWIISVYEVLRSAKEYSPNLMDMELFRDIGNVRIPLAKYQIAKDNKLRAPLRFAREGDSDVPEKIETYDPKDSQRHHTVPRGFSQRGSLQWCVIDVTDEKYEKWLERRDLADRFLQYMRSLPPA
ncbi:hypothetical protein CKO28_23420 [Rhodovibrio sodomensis]|uniref:Uncharacterized protein n=2 Tax=Rhodovibrio sodomensis TaxID=1088 RepID=A0ABS1DKC4_9PROT|nr:hypothetical protein [Rhodovibrio sodomensis]